MRWPRACWCLRWRRVRGGWTPTRLLLTGVVVAAGAGSVVSLLLAMSDDTRLRGMVFWLLGDLSRGDRWGWLLALLGRRDRLLRRARPSPRTCWRAARRMPPRVGLDVRRVRSVVFVLSSLLTGCAVSTAGSIGFVGLVTPHLVRLALGNDNRVVLPARRCSAASC